MRDPFGLIPRIIGIYVITVLILSYQNDRTAYRAEHEIERTMFYRSTWPDTWKAHAQPVFARYEGKGECLIMNRTKEGDIFDRKVLGIINCTELRFMGSFLRINGRSG